MSSSKCIDLWLRNVRCRGSPLSRHGLLISRAAFSTSSRICAASGPAYVQHPDKTHPVPMESTQPAVAGQIVLNRHSKLAEKLRSPKRTNDKSTAARDLTSEEQLVEMERLVALEDEVRFDYWSQPMQLLDVHIPSWTSSQKDASLLDHLKTIAATQVNWFKNASNMSRMANEDSFPGVHVKSRWSFEIFKVQSTPWLAPFREIALQTYKDVNTALAAGDAQTLKKFTGLEYQSHLLKLMRAQDRSRLYFWKLVKEETPCKVVSIRAPLIQLGSLAPKFGSRLAVQAVVKFDTLQTLQIYSKTGTLLAGDEKPRRVVQYLVFQKRLWYDTPWIIRSELFRTLQTKFT